MKRHTELNSLVALYLSDKICASAPTEVGVAMTGSLVTLGFPVHFQFPEFTQTHVHRVSDAI